MKKKRKVDFGAYAFLIPAAVIYLSVIVVPVGVCRSVKLC